MSDLINRKDAIDDLHGKDPSQIWDTADVEVWINELPSAEPEPHWIPCSERLPEDDGRYLVTNSRIGAWIIDIDLMLHGKWVHEADNHIAWREKPEPYQPRRK